MKPRSLNIISEASASPANYKASFAGRAAVVTLGCAKNQVDSEIILGALQKNGFEIVDSPTKADLAVVNTCGFLEAAVKEGIDCILDLSELKKTGSLKKLLVTGCMLPRYGEQLKTELPEVDAFVSPNDLAKVSVYTASEDLQQVFEDAARPYFIYDDTLPRVLSTKSHTAYVKVAEGCNRPCTFCIIPKIRGAMRSRSLTSIVKEVEDLVSLGVKEVNLVAQDLTSYGTDIKGPGLSELLIALNKTKIDWVRLLYAYPVGVNDQLLKNIVDLPKILNYLDIPLQHVSGLVLKAMKRPLGKLSPRALTEYIRKNYPEIAIRTTFIVGFPGETEQDILELENFITEGHFSNVGVFEYSPEIGTPAENMEAQISKQEKAERKARLMAAQKKALESNSSKFIGKTVKVLLEGAHSDTDLLLAGRAYFQAPEVDGIVIINDFGKYSNSALKIGEFYDIKIKEYIDYDFVGEVVCRSAAAGAQPSRLHHAS